MHPADLGRDPDSMIFEFHAHAGGRTAPIHGAGDACSVIEEGIVIGRDALVGRPEALKRGSGIRCLVRRYNARGDERPQRAGVEAVLEKQWEIPLLGILLRSRKDRHVGRALGLTWRNRVEGRAVLPAEPAVLGVEFERETADEPQFYGGSDGPATRVDHTIRTIRRIFVRTSTTVL
jgi:hypothetical protein